MIQYFFIILHRFLRGDYCLESDLEVTDPDKYNAVVHKTITYPSEIFHVSVDSVDSSRKYYLPV